MTRTFLVAIDDTNFPDAEALAEDITQILLDESIPVLSCKPWASHNPDSLDLNNFLATAP